MGLLAREDDLAGLVFHPLEQDLDRVARLRRRLVFPLVERDEALGLVADIDDDLVADDLDDLARDDGADLEALPLAQEVVEGLGSVFRGHDGRQFVVADIEFTKQVTIYHVSDSFRFRPARRGRTDSSNEAPAWSVREVLALPASPARVTPGGTPRSLGPTQPGKKKNHPSTQGVDLRKQLL